MDDARQRAQVAMWALADHLKALGYPFDSWPDAVKTAFSSALIDRRPLTEADIKRAHELSKRYNWRKL